MSDSLYIVIVGCGRLGSHLANQLSHVGHSVVVINREEATFNDVSPDFSGFRVEGDATQMTVLKEANIKGTVSMVEPSLEDAFSIFVKNGKEVANVR